MKVYISADMEGITGVTHWNEVNPEKPDYAQFQKRMTEEVASACRGALDAGTEKIVVKDAHYTGRNILPADLPEEVELIRGWSGHPYSMVQELDETFDALMMVGYHSRAGSGGNPLSHTMSSAKIERMIINGREASEFLLHGYVGAKHGVPIVFVSGDRELCTEVAEVSPSTATFPTMEGVGDSTVSVHPKKSLSSIRKIVCEALKAKRENNAWVLPDEFEMSIRYVKQTAAYRASQYHGAEAVSAKTVRYISRDYDDIMRFVLFCV